MLYTENYQFRKPIIGVDIADVKDVNFNSDKLDALLYNTQISLAPAYDLLETYNTGDIVMYETLMYKCKEDNVTGAWDPSKWERTTAGEEGSGGGGSSVVPNPQGEPTDTLNTIGIDGTIFDIAGSGGGSAYRDTLLYEDTSGAVDTSNITLDDSLGNYDALYFEYFFPNESTYVESTVSPLIPIVETPTGSTKGKYYISTYPTYGSRYITLTSDGSTSATLTTGTWGESIKPSIYRIHGIKYGSGSGRNSEIIPISAGDGTTSRTFTLRHIPKKVTLQGYTSGDGGWYESGYFIWGENFMNLIGAQYTVATGGYAGQATISYEADGKSFTITAANAFGAFNRADNFSGMMLVDYGAGDSSEEISDMTWTLLDSTTSTGTATPIPSGTKYIVVLSKDGNNGKVTMVAKESLSNINKVMDLLQETTYILGGYWKDQAGADYGDTSCQISNGQVIAYSSYRTNTTYVYAVS